VDVVDEVDVVDVGSATVVVMVVIGVFGSVGATVGAGGESVGSAADDPLVGGFDAGLGAGAPVVSVASGGAPSPAAEQAEASSTHAMAAARTLGRLMA
jgi:hypothetical protein